MKPNIVTKDFTISVPDEWVDKSMQIWSEPVVPGRLVAANVVVVRETLPPGQPLKAFANKQLKDLVNTGQDLEIETKQPIEWHGQPGIEIVFTWVNGGQHLKQRQLYIQHGENEIVSLVFTAAEDEFNDKEVIFNAISDTFTWNH
jgi:hypothetical protein